MFRFIGIVVTFILIFRSGAFSNEFKSNYTYEANLLSCETLENGYFLYYDEERNDSNNLYLPLDSDLYTEEIFHLYNSLNSFIYTNRDEFVTDGEEDDRFSYYGYYCVDTNLTVPFEFVVTITSKQEQLIRNKFQATFGRDNFFINTFYNYTISPGIVFQMILEVPDFLFFTNINTTLKDLNVIHQLYGPYFDTIVSSILIVAAIISLVESLLICTYKYLINKHNMQTPPDVYVFSLIVADMVESITRIGLLVLYSYEIEVMSINTTENIMIILHILYHGCGIAVLWTSVGMTIDRYIAICHPFIGLRYSTQRRAVKINISIWALSFILSFLHDYYFTLYAVESEYHLLELPNVHAIPIMILFIILPVCIVLLLYICITRSIWQSSRLRESYINNEHQLPGKSIKIAVVIAVKFLYYWIPCYGFNYVLNIINPNRKLSTTLFAVFWLSLLDLIACILIPVIYALVSRNYRNSFKDSGLLLFRWTRYQLSCTKNAIHMDQA